MRFIELAKNFSKYKKEFSNTVVIVARLTKQKQIQK